jgi:hypothetical protein
MAEYSFFSEGRQIANCEPNKFCIKMVWAGGLSDSQMALFASAASRWTRIISGDVPSYKVGGEEIDDIKITAKGAPIDGEYNVIGKCGPDVVRPKRFARYAFIPATASMTFDTADLDRLERSGMLIHTITHEMGHALGLGRWVWAQKGLLQGEGGADPRFIGPNAMREYGILKGGGPEPVPVEDDGGAGTRDSHWNEGTFDTEMMTGWIDATAPISRMTGGALQDLGYDIDYGGCDAYSLPPPDRDRQEQPPPGYVERTIPVVGD